MFKAVPFNIKLKLTVITSSFRADVVFMSLERTLAG